MKYISLSSSSSGNCYLIEDGDTRFLIDAGLSVKRIKALLADIGVELTSIKGVVLTHSHRDHTKGVPTLVYRYNLPLYCTKSTLQDLEKNTGREVDRALWREVESHKEFEIGGFTLLPMPVTHDTRDCHAYLVKLGEKTLTLATDLGKTTEELMEAVKVSDHLIIESNYSETLLQVSSYTAFLRGRIDSDCGHLSNVQTGEIVEYACKKGKVKHIHLAHISANSNTPETALNYSKKFVPDGVKIDTLPRKDKSEIWEI